MLAITHLAVSLLLIQALTLDRNDSFMALLFGVFIDADHLLGLKEYAQSKGVASVLDLDSLVQADGQWKSLLHNPMAAALVGPMSIGSRLAVPLLFWGVHVCMDQIEDIFLGVFSVPEIALLGLVSAVLAALHLRRGFCISCVARITCSLRAGAAFIIR